MVLIKVKNNSRMFLTNNSRKMHGLPLWRKKDNRKRLYTRRFEMEVIGAYLDWSCSRDN